MRLQSWQPSRHSIGCARLVTELTCLDASREVGAELASAHQGLCTAETGAGKFQRGSEVVPALISHIKSKHFLCKCYWSITCLPTGMFHCHENNQDTHQGHLLPGFSALSVLHPLLFGQGKRPQLPHHYYYHLIVHQLKLRFLCQLTLVLM